MPRARRRYRKSLPAALKRRLRDAGSLRKFAAQERINVRYVSDYVVRGIIPTNPRAAAALLPPRSLAHMRAGDRRRRHMRWWERLSALQRDHLIHFLYQYRGLKGQPK